MNGIRNSHPDVASVHSQAELQRMPYIWTVGSDGGVVVGLVRITKAGRRLKRYEPPDHQTLRLHRRPIRDPGRLHVLVVGLRR